MELRQEVQITIELSAEINTFYNGEELRLLIEQAAKKVFADKHPTFRSIRFREESAIYSNQGGWKEALIDFTKYDNTEVDEVAEHIRTGEIVLLEDDATEEETANYRNDPSWKTYFTVFGHLKEGGRDDLGDFANLEGDNGAIKQAEAFEKLIGNSK